VSRPMPAMASLVVSDRLDDSLDVTRGHVGNGWCSLCVNFG